MKVKFSVICQNGGGERALLLPGRFVLCKRCHGAGKHVNPAIDAHGLTHEDFDADPDFEEGYFSGRFDVPCFDCNGERVTPDIDLEKLPTKLALRVLDTRDAHEWLRRRNEDVYAC